MQDLPAAGCRSVLITLLGRYLAGQGRAAYSGTFIDVLGQAGFTDHAVRSALARMVPRGQLERHRRGRRTYFAPSPTMDRLLLDGRRRIYETTPVMTSWDGQWTLLSFSLPERRRAERHRLRVRLAWAGFGSLRHGLWVAPGRHETAALVEGLPVQDQVSSFHGRLHGPTSATQIVHRTWDLDAMALAYRSFIERWTDRDDATDMPTLARHLWLITDWRLLLRETQPLPAEVLPSDWPARGAEQCFAALDRRWRPEASAAFEAACDAIPTAATPTDDPAPHVG